MKAAQQILGQEIQLFLLRQGVSLDTLAKEVGVTPEALSNLIHGRRRFKDDTLVKLANTDVFCRGGFSLAKLKAFRAMDEYELDEIILAMLEFVKRGEINDLPQDFFSDLHQEVAHQPTPASPQRKKRLLAELIRSIGL